MSFEPFYALMVRAGGAVALEAAVAGDDVLRRETDVVACILAGHYCGDLDRVLQIDLAAAAAADVSADIARRLMADILDGDPKTRPFAVAFVERHQPFLWDDGAWIRVASAADWTLPLRNCDVVFPDRP